MKLLIVTQVIDREDPVLGFFHGWVKEFATNFESVVIICLKKGTYDLPDNVKVYSLGKEDGAGRITYVYRFFTYIYSLRKEYDKVFVHMNQEYLLLGGFFWKFWSKHMYMWRNHHAGNVLTDIAASFCTHVFCTSKYSYTVKYKRTIRMPVGIDTQLFRPREIVRRTNSILFIARIAPSKNLEMLIDALCILNKKGTSFELGVYGEPAAKDEEYMEAIKQKVFKNNLNVTFYGRINNFETPDVYSAYDMCVNMSSSGMYDKTIFEAMACGCLSIASNKNLVGLIDDMFIVEQDSVKDLVYKIEHFAQLDLRVKNEYRTVSRQVVEGHHSLSQLGNMLAQYIT